jgi:ubiquinone/menaquinone biosynthesis C-methylase UbiE
MNRHEQRSMESYDRIASTYNDSPEGRFTFKFNALLRGEVEIPGGGRLLDIACGTGRFLGMLAAERSFQGYGVDISGKMVENAALLYPTMTFRRAACDALPFDGDFFDAVTVCAAFHHFPHPAAFAREAFRVLRPGGRLYIAEIYYPALARALFNPILRFSKMGDVRFYAPEKISALLRGAGFSAGAVKIEGTAQIVSGRK